jgi:DNA-binding NtrC family response regulator
MTRSNGDHEGERGPRFEPRPFVIPPSRASQTLVVLPGGLRQISYYRPIEGESGTGKELVARQLHEVSRLSDAAVDALQLYAWPGNVRELERFIELAVALTESNQIELDDLPPQLRGDYVEIRGRTGCSPRSRPDSRTWCRKA